MAHRFPALFLLACLLFSPSPVAGAAGQRPAIRKLGTIDLAMVEATPFVFKGKLYRFEWVRTDYEGNRRGNHYRVVEHATGETVSTFADGHLFGCAFVEGDTAWAFGVDRAEGSRIDAFRSKDLVTWEKAGGVELAGWKLFNCSVCKVSDGPDAGSYVMAVEVGGPPEVTGTPFTTRFLRSKDLSAWELIPEPAVFTKDRYSACPTIRHVDGFYYMTYLEMFPGWVFETYIARSPDLVRWQLSPRNPVLRNADGDDKAVHNPRLTAEQRKRIEQAQDINNSDMDWAEFEGKLVISYSWGNQKGNEFLAEAAYDGTEEQFLKAWFPE